MKALVILLLAAMPSFASDASSFAEGMADGLRHALEARQGYQSQDYQSPRARAPEVVPQRSGVKQWSLINDNGVAVGVYSSLSDCRFMAAHMTGAYACELQ